MAISREHILREVRRTAAENGGKPLGRLSFFTQTGIKESDWRGKYWARWNNVLRDAGYGPRGPIIARPDEVLLDRLAALALELGRIPATREMRLKKRADASFPNDKTYTRFGPKALLLQKLRAFALERPQYQAIVSQIDALGFGEEESPTDETLSTSPKAGAEITPRDRDSYLPTTSPPDGRDPTRLSNS
jgi:hypothetical protein